MGIHHRDAEDCNQIVLGLVVVLVLEARWHQLDRV
jgi:hypothetical protein